MIWLLLVLALIIATPLVVEQRCRVMNDTARGSATGSFVELSQGVTHFEWYGPARGPVLVSVQGLTYTHTNYVLRLMRSWLKPPTV
jgi:hypothetical protein